MMIVCLMVGVCFLPVFVMLQDMLSLYILLYFKCIIVLCLKNLTFVQGCLMLLEEIIKCCSWLLFSAEGIFDQPLNFTEIKLEIGFRHL